MLDNTPPMTAIDATDLTKRFGNVTAVSGVALEIPRGTVYGFLGPNGAGKTTTMRMLTTLTPPTSGRASIAGAPITDRDGVRANIGYLPEEPPVFDELTGREQLEYFASLRDISNPTAAERIDRWLERFGLAEEANKRIDGYSKGMRQKIGLIQALLHEPAVLFLDEPTSGLDPRAARTMMDVIASLRDSGQTVFLSTHILPVVEELADIVGVLYEGQLVKEGAPETLTAELADAEGTSLEDVFLAVTTEQGTESPLESGFGGGSQFASAHNESGSGPSHDSDSEPPVGESSR